MIGSSHLLKIVRVVVVVVSVDVVNVFPLLYRAVEPVVNETMLVRPSLIIQIYRKIPTISPLVKRHKRRSGGKLVGTDIVSVPKHKQVIRRAFYAFPVVYANLYNLRHFLRLSRP